MKRFFSITSILVLAFSLRLVNISQSLWLDESINVLAAKNLSLWKFVASYPIGDFHPPLYFAVLWITSHLLGFSEFAVRLPSVILGVGTVYLTFKIGQLLINKKFGLIAAILLAINPLHIYYSQEARMYSLACFAATLSFYYLFKILKENSQVYYLYVFSLVLVLYSDYLVYLVLPTQLLIVILLKKDKILKFIYSQLIAGVFLIPWLFIFPAQLASGRLTAENVPGWKLVVGGSNLKNFLLVYVKAIIGRVSLDNKNIYYLLVSIIGFIYTFLISLSLVKKFKTGFKNIDPTLVALLFWVFIPSLIALLVSYFIPVLSYFRMLFIVPGLVLLTAFCLKELSPKIMGVFLTLIIAISLGCTSLYYFNPKFQRENWKGLVQLLEDKGNSNSLVLFEDSNLPAPFIYYDQEKILATGAIKNFPADDIADIIDLQSELKNRSTVLLVDYLVEISDSQRLVDKKLTSLNWQVVKVYNLPTIGFIYEYHRAN